MDGVLEGAALILVLAGAIEFVVEGLKPAMDPIVTAVRLPESVPLYRYLAILLGVIFATLYQANILLVLGLVPPSNAADLAGVVLTGIALGFGSGVVHDFLQNRGSR